MSPKKLLLLAAVAAASVAVAAEKPKLTAFERSQGWRLLFDGRDVSEWRGYRAEKLPANWAVVDESLRGSAGSAIVTTADYGDFEFTFDWKVGEGGQGAVLFHVTEDAATPDRSGPQMLLVGHGAGFGGNGLGAPDRAITPQFDVWYRSKIVVFGNVVEHWINNERVHTYAIDSSEWKKAVAASPFAGARELGKARTGLIALTGDKVEFRNLKVRSL